MKSLEELEKWAKEVQYTKLNQLIWTSDNFLDLMDELRQIRLEIKELRTGEQWNQK